MQVTIDENAGALVPRDLSTVTNPDLAAMTATETIDAALPSHPQTSIATSRVRTPRLLPSP